VNKDCKKQSFELDVAYCLHSVTVNAIEVCISASASNPRSGHCSDIFLYGLMRDATADRFASRWWWWWL